MTHRPHLLAAGLGALAASTSALAAPPADDRAAVAALDTRYQAAVKANDAAAMDAILHPDMTLVVGVGTVVPRAQLIEAARSKWAVYEAQDEEPGSQTVRLYGHDTAVVTAKLWVKYTSGGKAFDRKLWFTDTYVGTPAGWKYAFGQASIPLPDA